VTAQPLEQLGRRDDVRYGGKSASLGDLLANGIPVPPGFALPAGAFRTFLDEAGLAARVKRSLGALNPEDVAALQAASAELVDAVRSAPVPAAVRAEVVRCYHDLATAACEDAPPVAVRSSAVGEDSAEATFAGQQATYLWVRGDERVCDAVRDCWASLYSTAALSYRARMGPAGGEPAMGVTIQRMVDAAVSGVMFTCNPVSGDPSTVAIDASWGLGLAVVGGEVTPDEFRVSKVTREVLHRSVGAKAIAVVPDPLGSGTVRADVPAERRDVPCLGQEALDALVDMARRVERHFGEHQDIEWAIDRDGTLFVLQSRPVTTLRARPEPPVGQSAMALVMSTFGVSGNAGEHS
jgi:pyruvate,water dikinase